MTSTVTDDHERLVAVVLEAWLRTCVDVVAPTDLDRLTRTVAELLRLAAEGANVQELRIVAAARLASARAVSS